MAKVCAAVRLCQASLFTGPSLNPTNSPTDVHAALHCFWDLASQNDDRFPPAKRRKLDTVQDATPAQPRQLAAVNDYVHLADIAIGLGVTNRPSTPHLSPDIDDSAYETIPVDLLHSFRDPHCDILLTISCGLTRINLSCNETGGESLWQHLDIAAQYSRNVPNNPSLPCWVDCYLVRSRQQGTDTFALHIKINYQAGPPLDRRLSQDYGKALAKYFPLPQSKRPTWSPKEFYDNVYIPKTDDASVEKDQLSGLETELYPFQKRAVSWLASRECTSTGPNTLDKDKAKASHDYPRTGLSRAAFIAYRDASGNACFVNHLFGCVSRDLSELDRPDDLIYGGILAEEMGLGKTVELIALMCLNKRQVITSNEDIVDEYTQLRVMPSKTTLIITPPAILDQWISELRQHAPSFKVYNYQGMMNRSQRVTAKILSTFDVVLTTYPVLAREIHWTEKRPDRNLRHAKKYETATSPLLECQWWRVCLDEAQMVESGVTNAAKVARRIPRCNAWAISGTPLRKNVNDLLGLLIFLRAEPFCTSSVWNRMLGLHPDVFKNIFSVLALRHTKAQIRDELEIPSQKRVVVTVPFTAIEEQHYGNIFDQMCHDCGLDKDGAPRHGDWDPEDGRTVEKMRNWLTRLRQTCLHPEVGDRNRKALGHRTGPLRTVEEVLEVMIDQNETNLRSEERQTLMSRIMQGHLYSFSKDGNKALDIYTAAYKEAAEATRDCKMHYLQARARFMEQKSEKAEDTGKQSLKFDDSTASDDEGESPERQNESLTLRRQRYRSALEMEHICVFFRATAYFQLKSDTATVEEGSQHFRDLEKKESELYEDAKLIRQELLAETSGQVNRFIKRVKATQSKRGVIPPMDYFANFGGIESRKLIGLVETIRELLNNQSHLLEGWRDKLLTSLSTNLVDQDEGIEMTGEEYDDSLKQQDEQYTYLFALRAAIADRQEMLSGQRNELVKYEVKEALKMAAEGQGHSPDLLKACMTARAELALDNRNPLSIRGIVSDLRSMITSVRFNDAKGSRAAAEAGILENELANLQQVAATQTKALAALEKELDLCRNAMNARIEYYRQLQVISDTVKPLQEDMSESLDQAKLDQELTKERVHQEKLTSLRTKARFLQHLRATETNEKQEQQLCIICQSLFENGVLTSCGHIFCGDCLRMWMNEHRNCPMCKKSLTRNDLHNITYKPRDMQAQEEHHSPTSPESNVDSPSKAASRTSIYSDISPNALNQIKSVNLSTSWGSKIDAISRHLLWLRASDPGSKSVVFSQYRDFLDVLARAFRHFKIGYAEMDKKNGIVKFKEDPSVEVFLLSAKSNSSGLNLVNATHVFLCEPLINAAIELQAIARVHRIGQRRETTVWMYLVSNTVEEAIYDISVSRRLEHIRRVGTLSAERSRAATPSAAVEETRLDAANSMELQAAPLSQLLTHGKSGGEVVAQDDLWNCLFGKPRGRDEGQALGGVVEEVIGWHLRAEAAESRRNGAVDAV